MKCERGDSKGIDYCVKNQISFDSNFALTKKEGVSETTKNMKIRL